MAETEQLRLPREGEWWEKISCPKDHPLPGGMAWPQGPVQWGYTVGEFTEGRSGFHKPRWYALFEAEKAAVGCGCLRRLLDYGDTQECIRLVREFFKGRLDKENAWFEARNPLLGNVSPNDMIQVGRAERLLKFIRTQLLENEQS